MATQVRETSAGKSISAYVVLNKKGVHVATVNAHFSNGGTVTVDTWNHGDAAQWNCLVTARRTGRMSDKELQRTIAAAPDYYLDHEAREKWASYELFGLQQGRAGGGGYDKFAAALSGMIIDGHTIANHCGAVPEVEKARVRLLKAHQKAAASGVDGSREWSEKAKKIGARFANWNSEANCYSSLHFEAGLRRLEDMGYQVISAI